MVAVVPMVGVFVVFSISRDDEDSNFSIYAEAPHGPHTPTFHFEMVGRGTHGSRDFVSAFMSREDEEFDFAIHAQSLHAYQAVERGSDGPHSA
jgi:hypothetical protein